MRTAIVGGLWKRAWGAKLKFIAALTVPLVLFATAGFAQQTTPQIVPDGNTQTRVTTSGGVTNVTTSTVNGNNAYNSFSTFNVNSGSVANLYLPNGTSNLLNLVNSQAVNIDGMLNAIEDGKIGGNVFFADPYGVIVGASGVVNVGSFTALTPTQDFMSQFFTSPGNPSPGATAAVLNGAVPISPDGLISIKGTVNATGNVGLYGGTVSNTGVIQSGAVFSGSSSDFSDVVNTNGLQNGTSIAVQNGNIVIQSAGDVENAGAIATNGGNDLGAGSISIQAGDNVNLDLGSVISASGKGQNSNGGNITINGAGNGEVSSGAVVEASGGDVSGNGGTVDFSAKGTVNLDGGVLKAGATNGTAGTVTLDPTDLTINSNVQPNDGSNLDFTADDSITVGSGVTISSRQIGSGTSQLTSPSTGNSGDISFDAPQITVGDSAFILANVEPGSTYNPGNITMKADSSSEAAQAMAQASITIGNATLAAGDITLNATSDATADNTVNSFVQTTLNDLNLGFLVTGPAASDTSSATSTVTIGNPSSTGQAILNATGDVAINSTATSDTKINIVGAPQGVAFGQADASAAATIGSNATITAGGKFDLSAKTKDNLELLSQTGSTTPLNVAVSYGKANSTSTAAIDGNVTADEINVETENDNKFATEAKGFNNTGGGAAAAGIGVALGYYQSSANTMVPGSLTAQNGDVNISSTSTNDENATRSESEVTDKTDLGKIENQTVPFLGTLSGFIKSHSSTKPEANPNPFGLAAAVSYMSSSNKASSNVSGSVTADQGAVSIDGTATDNPKISAAGSSDGANVSIGGGVAMGNFKNEADATITSSAFITAANNVEVNADAEIPNPVTTGFDELAKGFDGFTGVDFSNNVINNSGTGWGQSLWNNLQTLYTGVKGVQADVVNPGAFFTSFTNTGLSAEGSGTVGLAGSVDLTSVTNQADAHIAGTAQVASDTGDVKVNATSNATIINVAGMAFSLDSVLDLNPGVSGGSSLGGSYAGITLNNSSKAYIGDGTQVTATDGSVNVGSDTQSFVLDVVQSGDKAEKFGITGAFDWLHANDSSEAYIQSDATVSAGQDVNVNATNDLKDFVVDGALGMGGTVQVGVTTGWNQIDNTTLAYIGDPSNSRTSICPGCGVTASGDVNVKAKSKEDVYAISLAASKSGSSGEGADGESSSQPTGETAPSNSGSGAESANGAGGGEYGFGISANIAFNQINDGSGGPGVTTDAFINNGAKVNATGDINLNASDNSFVVAAGVAASLGQTLSLAGAYSQNNFIKQVEAYTENSTLGAKGLNVTADDQGDLFDISAGGGVNTESGIALAGSVNNNSITNTTEAYLGSGTTATGIGNDGITLSAQEGSASGGDKIVSAAGGFGIGLDGGGIGAGIDLGNYTNTVKASVESGADTSSTGNAQITADTNVFMLPIAVTFGFGSDFGAAGSFAYEQLTNNTAGSIDGTLWTPDNLLIGSNDTSKVLIIGGGVGVGGDAGVGVTGVIPSINRTTTASIGDNANVTALGSDSSPLAYKNQTFVGSLLDATSNGSLSDYVIAGGGGGVAGVAGAVILNPFFQNNTDTLDDTTEATIGNNATVNGNNSGSAGDQSVMLEAKDSTGILDVAGALSIAADGAVGVGFDQVNPVWTVKTGIGSGSTVNATDNVVTSSTLDNSLKSFALAASGSADEVSGSGAGAASVLNVTTNTDSYVNGTVLAGGNVEVAADRNTNSLNTVDGDAAVAISLGAGVGVSVGKITTNDTVDASIGATGNITALGNGPALNAPDGQLDGSGNPMLSPFQGVSVTAMSHSSINPITAGVAGSGLAGGQGSVLDNHFAETTKAHIDSGAQVNVNGDSGANANQSVQALATDKTDLNSIAGGLSLGGLALTASVDTETLNRTVDAYISGATVNAADNALVEGSILGSLTSTAVAGSAGGFAADGAVSTINETTNTNAYIGGWSNVTAGGNVGILANRDTSLTTQDGSVAAGGTLGVNGSVSVVNKNDTVSAFVGSNTSVTALGHGTGLTVPVDSNGSMATATLNGLSVAATAQETLQTISIGASVTGGFSGTGSATTNNITENTSAKIKGGATINGSNAGASSNQGVNVLAADNTTLTSGDGAAAASLDVGAGIGAGVDVGSIRKTTVAGIDNGASVNALGAVNVDALSSENINSYVAAVGGSIGVGLAGTTADYSTNPIRTTTTAHVGSCTASSGCSSGATVNAGGLGVYANDSLNFNVITGELSGGTAALGAGTFEVTADGNTSAYIGALSNIRTNSGGVQVGSDFTDKLTGMALAGSGAAVSGEAAYSTTTDNSNNSAFIADGANVTSKGDLDVQATTNRTNSGTTSGLSVGGLAAGASLSNVDVFGTTEAFVGNASATSTAGAINVKANLSDNSAATSNGIGGGVGSGVGTNPHVTDDAITYAFAGSGAKLSSSGTTTIAAQATRNATASSGSTSVGGVAVGESLATVSISGKTEAYLASGAQVGSSGSPSGGLSVEASDTDTGTATATPLAGGVGAGIGGKTRGDLNPTVSAYDNGATVNVSGAMNVNASDSSAVNSTVVGKQLGAVTGGSVDAEGSATPTISAYVNGGTAKAGSIAVTATGNQSMGVNGTSSASSSFVSGMSISATGTLGPSISASVSGGANLTAENNLEVSTYSENHIFSLNANGAAGAFNVGSGGSTYATGTIANHNDVTLGSATLNSTSGNLNVESQSNNAIDNANAYTYTGSGFVNVGGATSTADMGDNTTTTLLDGASLVALNGDLGVGASSSESVGTSADNPNGLSAVANSTAEASTNADANIRTEIESGANVEGQATTIYSLVPEFVAKADSNASASGVLGVGSYATSNLNATGTPTVEVFGGATVEGINSLTLNAEAGAPDGSGVSLTSSASTYARAGIVPVSEATSNNNSTLTSLVQADTGSVLITNSLDVNSLVPSTSVYSKSASASWFDYALCAVTLGIKCSGTGTENTSGSANFTNTITLNNILKQPTSELADLTINPDGTYSGIFPVQGEDGSNIVLQNVNGNQLLPKITLNAPGGTVQGNMTVDPSVKIVNNSDLNLILQGISTESGNTPPNITINAAHNDISTSISSMPITIDNNTGSDVIFGGNVFDPPGTLNVNNVGGDILNLAGVDLTVNSINFDAPHGSIGTLGTLSCSGQGCPSAAVNGVMTAGAFHLSLVPVPMTINGVATELPGQVSAVARGDIDLNLTPTNFLDAAPSSGYSIPVDLNNLLSGGAINLTLNPGEVIWNTGTSSGTTSVAGAFEIPSGDWVGAEGPVAVNMTGNSNAVPTLNIDGALTSGFQNISFTINPDGSLSSMVSAGGNSSTDLINYAQSIGSSVVLSNINASQTGINISGIGNLSGSGQLAVLNGASNIGISNLSSLPLVSQNIEDAQTYAPVTISLAGSVDIEPETYGNGLGVIDISSGPTVDLEGLLDSPSGTTLIGSSEGDITGPLNQLLIKSNNIDLFAAGSIGPNLGIEMTGPLGILNAYAGDSIGLTSLEGDMGVGTVYSNSGDVSLTTDAGSILNANPDGGVNVTGNNITLTSNGSIGTSGTRLVVDNRNPSTITDGTPDGSNYLDMSAQGDIYVEERSGNLLSHSISSTDGNINLLVSNGNGNLDQVVGNQNITATVDGSLLNINNITGSTATSQKMASPNNVSLNVLTAGGTLNVNHMDVFQSVTTRADNTNLFDVVHTNLADPQLDTDVQANALHFDDRGATGGIADNININVAPCAQCTTTPAVIFDHYWTQTGNVNASVDWLEFINTIVGTKATFANNFLKVRLLNKYADTGSSKEFTPWYMFMIGDKMADNADSIESKYRSFLDPRVHPVYYQPIGKIYEYLLTSYGFRP